MNYILPMLIYMFVMAITPGPNNLTMLYLGGSNGLGGSFRFLAASTFGFFAKNVICAFLNVALADIVPQIVSYLKWVGAAYMLYLAWNMAKSGWQKGEVSGKEGGNTLKNGIILQVLNAKSWIAALTVYATYAIPYTNSGILMVAFAGMFTVLMIASSLLWGLCGEILRKFITRYRKAFGLIMATSLVYCAVSAVV